VQTPSPDSDSDKTIPGPVHQRKPHWGSGSRSAARSGCTMPSMVKMQQIKQEHESSRSVTKPKLDEVVVQVKHHLTRLQNMKPLDLVMTSWKDRHSCMDWTDAWDETARKKKKRENKIDGSHGMHHTCTLTYQSMKGTKKNVSRNVSGG